jgi:hypothetical protein
MMNGINKVSTITAMSNDVLWNRQIARKKHYEYIIQWLKSIVLYGADRWKFNKKISIKTYVEANGFVKEIGEMLKIRKEYK